MIRKDAWIKSEGFFANLFRFSPRNNSISYSTKDSKFVDELSAELVKNRIQVWLDKWEMQPGDSLIDKIQNGISDSSFLLVVLSNNSVESEWCKKELNSGLMRELNEKKVVVIPILIDNCKIPLFLQEKVYADFREDFNSGLKSLLRPLSKLFSEHMGRQTKNEIVTDYAVSWGLNENGNFYLNIDLVNWYEKARKSFLLQIQVIGCKNATTRYLQQVKSGLNWLMKETVISVIIASKDFRELNILVDKDEVHNSYFKTKDIKMDISFDINLRAVLMGEDNGNDILINFIDFLEMLDSSRSERMQSK
ncbi:MAG: toll/interleukin-1 receptor domain-containing protein [Bacteroidota bacterium]|nr:toll/interleukin-1 receptor domain-containing protein [Bacteroidota bacterium]